jgi:hypothetical protein
MLAEDLDVRPGAARVGAIYPADISSLDAHTYFVPEAGPFKFVRKPASVERSRPLDHEVSTIDRHLACFAFIPS